MPHTTEPDRITYPTDKTTQLALALEGYASLDAEEAEALTDMFIQTTRKAIERRLVRRYRH